MWFREVMVGYSENRAEHINVMCGQNVVFIYVKAGGTKWPQGCKMSKVKLKFKVFMSNSVTNSMEQNPSWEADISLASQESPPPQSPQNYVISNTI